jgi:hypothetical protein
MPANFLSPDLHGTLAHVAELLACHTELLARKIDHCEYRSPLERRHGELCMRQFLIFLELEAMTLDVSLLATVVAHAIIHLLSDESSQLFLHLALYCGLHSLFRAQQDSKRVLQSGIALFES